MLLFNKFRQLILHYDRKAMFTKRLLNVGWKIALVSIIALILICHFLFAPLPVESSSAIISSITEEIMGTGTLEARVRATISPKISGLIAQVLVDQGDKVTKGQKLVILDDEDLRQQVEIAKAELSVAHAGVEKAVSGIKSAEATEKEAKSSYARISQLAPSGAVSVDTLEKSQQQMEVAQAELNQAQTAKIEAEKLVIKAEASLQFAQAQLAYTVINAPFDGLIIRRYRDPGDIAVPGSLVLDMISLDELWISAWVDESAMAELAIGQAARIMFRSEPEKFYKGTVSRISPLADRETREFTIDVLIKELPKIWAVGQRAEAYIQIGQKDNALVVPQSAVVWQKGKPGLFISNNGHAKWINVEIGLQGKDTVEILSGIKVNDVVIWSRDAKKAITQNRAVRTK